MDIGTAMLLSSGIGLGGSLLGGLAQKSGGNVSREASRRQIELAKNQALINSQMLAPFLGAGYGALQRLYGLSPVSGPGVAPGTASGGAAGGGNAFAVPYLYTSGGSWKSPTGVAYAGYTMGDMYDPTGGASRYMRRLERLPAELRYEGVDTRRFLPLVEQFGQNFQFNEDDPAYRLKKEIAERDINRAAAARGLYGSSAALNQIDTALRSILADEYDKQYGRAYGNILDAYGIASQEDTRAYGRAADTYGRRRATITDLYNMAMQQGATGYNALVDAVKMALGSASTAGALGNQAVGQLQSAYGQMAGNALANAQNQAALYGSLAGIGMGGINNYMLYKLLSQSQPSSYPAGGGYWGWGS